MQIMVLNFLKKKDLWSEIGGIDGCLAALRQIAADYHDLDNRNIGYTKSDTIWGRLAEASQFLKKNTYENRKWLFTAWQENRRKIRTAFLKTELDSTVRSTFDKSTDIDDKKNQSRIEPVSFCFAQIIDWYI